MDLFFFSVMQKPWDERFGSLEPYKISFLSARGWKQAERCIGRAPCKWRTRKPRPGQVSGLCSRFPHCAWKRGRAFVCGSALRVHTQKGLGVCAFVCAFPAPGHSKAARSEARPATLQRARVLPCCAAFCRVPGAAQASTLPPPSLPSAQPCFFLSLPLLIDSLPGPKKEANVALLQRTRCFLGVVVLGLPAGRCCSARGGASGKLQGPGSPRGWRACAESTLREKKKRSSLRLPPPLPGSGFRVSR